MTVQPSGSPLLSCCDRSGITPDWFPAQRVFVKIKQLIAVTVLADRPWLTQFMFKLNSLPCQFLLWGQVAWSFTNKKRKKKKTCSSLEAMISRMQFLAWLTMRRYQPAATDALGFHVETPRLHKREREWNMIYMARRKPTFKSDRKTRTCHCIAMQRASWKRWKKIVGSVHGGVSWLCFWEAGSNKERACVCVARSQQSNLIYVVTF